MGNYVPRVPGSHDLRYDVLRNKMVILFFTGRRPVKYSQHLFRHCVSLLVRSLVYCLEVRMSSKLQLCSEAWREVRLPILCIKCMI